MHNNTHRFIADHDGIVFVHNFKIALEEIGRGHIVIFRMWIAHIFVNKIDLDSIPHPQTVLGSTFFTVDRNLPLANKAKNCRQRRMRQTFSEKTVEAGSGGFFVDLENFHSDLSVLFGRCMARYIEDTATVKRSDYSTRLHIYARYCRSMSGTEFPREPHGAVSKGDHFLLCGY